MKETPKEDIIETSPIPVSIQGTENILFQMKTSICKIYTKNELIGTGFFLKVSFEDDVLFFLVANYDILEDVKENDEIEITRNNDNISNNIILNNKRKIYKYPEIEALFIEIYPKEDKIEENEFLEIDDNINNDIKIIEKKYRNKSVYILHYPNGDDIKVSYGLLNGIINNKDLNHNCRTKDGSSGSPIISLKNNKVIGIHIGSTENNNNPFNGGIFIKEVLNKLLKDINNMDEINNEIKLKIKIEKKDVNKKIYLLDNTDGKFFINGKWEEYHHNCLKELNESNTDIFINSKQFKFKKFFEPIEIGIYDIIIKLNVQMTDCSFMFYGCKNLTEIDLSSFDTSNVINMSGMFSQCNNLTKINLSSLDTSNVINMNCMFFGCNSLTNIDLSSFDTTNVTNMRGMLSQCKNLTNIDLSSFNTQNVADMSFILSGCINLIKLNLSSFDTKNVTNMRGMFHNCSITDIKLTSFDTTNVIDMSYMFYGCKNLSKIKLTSFDTKNVTNMSYMFFECKNLTKIKLSSFDTKNVTNMRYMFSGCINLTKINLSSFDTNKVTNMKCMFSGCINLTNINLSSFDINEVSNMKYMFNECNNLNEIKINQNSYQKIKDEIDNDNINLLVV